MKKIFCLLAVILSVFSLSAKPPLGWLTSLEEAQKKAKEENKLIYLLFTGSDRKWGPELQSEVLNSSDFDTIIDEDCVPVYIDFPRRKKLSAKETAYNKALMKKMKGGNSVPTALILTPDGKEIGRIKGFRKKPLYIAEMKPFLKQKPKNSDPQKTSQAAAPRSAANTVYAPPKGWHSSVEEALKAAKGKKDVFILLTGSDWCGFCVRLKKQLLETKQFKDLAAKNFELVYLDFPRKKIPEAQRQYNNQTARELRSRLGGAGGYPTVILMGSNGKLKGSVIGFGNAQGFLSRLERVRKLPANK